MKVFMGGTCPGWAWRDELVQMMDHRIDAYNPIVSDWNEAAQQQELRKRAECDYCLYVITPHMQGAYSIAEAVDDSNKRPEKVIFAVIDSPHADYGKKERHSLKAVARMIRRNGGRVFGSLEDTATFLNLQCFERE